MKIRIGHDQMRYGLFLLMAGCALGFGSGALGEDYWTPRGQPGTTNAEMKTLDQVEPRKLIATLPFVIRAPGSYYLAANMSGGSNSVGIQVESSDVQIDLNGFALIGTNGSLDGIRVLGTNENITIRNGSIREWGGFGINGPDANDGSILDIKANRNGFGGVLYGEGAMISHCTAYGNGYKAPPPPAHVGGNPNEDSDFDGMNDNFEWQIINHDAADAIQTLADVLPWMDAGQPIIKSDFDGDGIANKMEFDQGKDPTFNDNYMPTDMDTDGMDDGFEWGIINFNMMDNIATLADVWPWYMPDMNTNMPPGSGPTNKWDFDLDGAANKQEFIARTQPTNAASKPSEGGVQSEYANYDKPMAIVVDDFVDPTDEPKDDGIRGGSFSTIQDCKARDNRGSGIFAKYGSRIVSCIAAGNMVDGIHVSDYCTVIDCTLARNNKDGMTIGSKCRAQDNNCGQNGDYAKSNQMMPQGAGIKILGDGNRVENNNVSGNALGIEVDNSFSGGGREAGQNLIIGNSSSANWGKAFDLATGDFMGGQAYEGDVSAAGAGGTTNAVMDKTNPFSNFSF